MISYGAPIPISRSEVEKFKVGGIQKREAIANLIKAGQEGLKTVTVNSPDYETLRVSYKMLIYWLQYKRYIEVFFR